MKKPFFSLVTLIPIYFIFICSCSKSNDVTNDKIPDAQFLLQNKWILNSLRAYPSRDFSGNDFIGFMGNGKDYYNFGTDGKIYSFTAGIYDTTGFKLLPNDSTLLIYKFIKGQKADVPDTATIIKLTADSLTWWHRNPGGDYGRFSFIK